MINFSDTLAALQQQIADAARRAGRDASAVTLIAVTKTHPVETIEFALRAGLHHFGENKVQEAHAKIELLGERGRWHLIGHLQTNKAKLAAQIFDQIDSLDSLELAQLLSQAASDTGRHLPVLLQVNVAGESQKFGVRPAEVAALATAVNALPGLELQGLMTIPPFCEKAEESRPYFVQLREWRDRVETETGLHLPQLSMGMSHDFTIAIEEGSTQVRVGSALFGARQPSRLSTKPTLD